MDELTQHQRDVLARMDRQGKKASALEAEIVRLMAEHERLGSKISDLIHERESIVGNIPMRVPRDQYGRIVIPAASE